MIGWIALAGIIVRNSILLVDFSVHRIQEGDTVVDAVISSCKTRTRPILITALALVAGSSVIFFDPIFQGMAISLASGVLVSTILTLVVIPLGCVAAADSLCAVAGSTKCRKFPRGSGPDDGPGGGGKPAPAPGDPLWVRAWSGFAGVLFTTIGVVAALVGMIARLFRSRRKAVPPAGAQPAPVTQREAPAAATLSASDTAETATEAPVADPKPAPKVTTKKVTASKPGTKKTAAKKPPVKKTSVKEASVKKATSKKKPPARKPASKRVAVKKVPAEKTAPSKKASTPRAAANKVASTPKQPASRKKTGGRRGIQLKTLGKPSGDGLN
jgi:multidrug efflux pump subunit AcrB